MSSNSLSTRPGRIVKPPAVGLPVCPKRLHQRAVSGARFDSRDKNARLVPVSINASILTWSLRTPNECVLE